MSEAQKNKLGERHLWGLGAVLLAGGLALGGCGDNKSEVSASTTQASSPSATPSVRVSGQTYPEIADHRPTLQLWSDNNGTPANGALALGKVVDVECLAPNNSGMPSAEPGFYRFELNGETKYAIANEFANGDPVGVNGFNTLVDPAVPEC